MPIAPVFLHFGWAFGGTEFFLICDYKGISSSEEGQKKTYYKNTPKCSYVEYSSLREQIIPSVISILRAKCATLINRNSKKVWYTSTPHDIPQQLARVDQCNQHSSQVFKNFRLKKTAEFSESKSAF